MRKWLWVLSVVAIATVLPVPMARAVDSGREATLEAAYQRLTKAMDPDDMKKLYSLLDRMKTAGLVYDERLVVPERNVVACKTPEQLHVLWGIMAMDATYALLFEKSPERFVAEGKKLEERIAFPRDVLKQESVVMNRDEKVDKSVAFTLAMLKTAKTDPVVLNMFVGGFYGSTIELFHLFCSLGLATGVTKEYLELVNVHVPQLALAKEILDAYSDNGELTKLLDTDNRRRVISSIIDIIGAKLGKLTEGDLGRILEIIGAVRDPLVAACN
jgi:hypothetical protein